MTPIDSLSSDINNGVTELRRMMGNINIAQTHAVQLSTVHVSLTSDQSQYPDAEFTLTT